MATPAISNDPRERLARSARRRSRLDPEAEGAARHGVATSPAAEVEPDARGAHFGRLFPFLPARNPGVDAIRELADAMESLTRDGIDGRENPLLPAGYTYLGQFIDHDITFDTTSRLGQRNEPSALVNARTPRLDLDSVYGGGPVEQPFLYDWRCEHPGAKLLVTTNPVGSTLPCGALRARHDLPRNDQGRALIGDPRNDENLIISQMHLLLMRFHNAVVDRIGGPDLTGTTLFERARRIVRRHYQWIVVHDFLPKLVGRVTAAAITPRPLQAADTSTGTPRIYPWREAPVIPVEFAAAAYRVGHSMVRPSYRIGEIASIPILPGSGDSDCGLHLGGFRPLRADLKIVWGRGQFFYEGDAAPEQNCSMRMDEYLSRPLFELPVRFTGGQVPPGARRDVGVPATDELARLNLSRGLTFGLPAGADVARALGHEPLTPEQLFPSPTFEQDVMGHVPGVELPDETKSAIVEATPLWYYILREAAVYNEHGVVGLPDGGRYERVAFCGCQLGPVGGRIVAEVLVGLLESDPWSYVNANPAWTPHHDSNELQFAPGHKFTMLDLIRFTEEASGDDDA